MINTSATGGYLSPNDQVGPAEDAALITIFQQMVVGLTRIDGTLVRPRWQPVMPTTPCNNVDWAAVGIQTRKGDTFAYVEHDPSGDGSDVVLRQEELEVLCSIYGPNADNNASLIRDGLSIPQNLETLKGAGISLANVGPPRIMSTVINTLWYYRLDMVLYMRRLIRRTYPVLNLLSAEVVLDSSDGVSTTTFELNIS